MQSMSQSMTQQAGLVWVEANERWTELVKTKEAAKSGRANSMWDLVVLLPSQLRLLLQAAAVFGSCCFGFAVFSQTAFVRREVAA